MGAPVRANHDRPLSRTQKLPSINADVPYNIRMLIGILRRVFLHRETRAHVDVRLLQALSLPELKRAPTCLRSVCSGLPYLACQMAAGFVICVNSPAPPSGQS